MWRTRAPERRDAPALGMEPLFARGDQSASETRRADAVVAPGGPARYRRRGGGGLIGPKTRVTHVKLGARLVGRGRAGIRARILACVRNKAAASLRERDARPLRERIGVGSRASHV